ncbi:hypothetical protein E4U42_004109 [Claviceps africana]|uniref:Acyl-CoA thioesterase-like C-terminal domain-containing protein n=1 Tax=Claviceps africana TaxID=83212 RepID=A0A8K0J8I1_9HYPO|nr:hypothetical protein E4U42_004109 [Claviceps africana]
MIEFDESLAAAREKVVAAYRDWPRKGFADFMKLTPIPDEAGRQGRPAWVPGNELPWDVLFQNTKEQQLGHKRWAASGGCVYAQASLAAARAIEEEERQRKEATGDALPRTGIHGVFMAPGLSDRPFLFDVSSVGDARTFFGRRIDVRQPAQPSSDREGPFPESDAELPLKEICYSCIKTFKRPTENIDDVQSPESAQKRYADLLSQRAPDQWEHAPQFDVDINNALFPGAGHGAFPVLDIYKVDMSRWNEGKEVPDRRQLLLYRPISPIPRNDINGHIACHAFETDRNSLTMIANHMGYGMNMGVAATLSCCFFVHTNPEDAVMEGDGWWIQEINWPRVVAGRAMMESRIWSPQGKHVASAFQDGLVKPAKAPLSVKETSAKL